MTYYMTSAEKLIIEQGRLEAKLEGFQQGWTNGWHEGVKTTQHGLLDMLMKHKYGISATRNYTERLRSITAVEAQDLCKKLLTSPTIELLFI